MWFWKLYWKYTILVIYCSNFNRQSNRKIVHNNKTHPCFIWTKTSRFHEEIKYKNKAVFGIVIFASILGQGLTGTKLAAWQGWWSTRKCSERLIIGIWICKNGFYSAGGVICNHMQNLICRTSPNGPRNAV